MEEKLEKEENLKSKKTGEGIKGKDFKESNKKPSEEKSQNELAKAPKLEEDRSIPELYSEKVYKVRSCIIIPH